MTIYNIIFNNNNKYNFMYYLLNKQRHAKHIMSCLVFEYFKVAFFSKIGPVKVEDKILPKHELFVCPFAEKTNIHFLVRMCLVIEIN